MSNKESTSLKKEAFAADPVSKTPEKPKRRASSSVQQHPIPSTPPLNSSHKFSSENYQSPNDYITSATSFGVPTTPSSHSHNKSRLSNVPSTPQSSQRNYNLSTSPLKSPPSFPEHPDDIATPPIRQISSNLKTRLSYAFVKYQHGWTNQSLDELEKSVGSEREFLEEPPKGLSKTYDEFWNHNSSSKIPIHKSKSPSKVTKPVTPLRSPNKGKYSRRSSLDVEDNDGSANLAFLQVISRSKSPKKRAFLQNNLSLDPSAFISSTQSSSNTLQPPNKNPEAEAIESLMSLSSPQSFKPRLENTRLHDLPRHRLSFGEGLSKNNNDTAIETESETEYEHETDAEVENDTNSESNNSRSEIRSPTSS